MNDTAPGRRDARIQALREEIIRLEALLDSPKTARRRTRKLLVGAAGLAGSFILSPITAFGGFALTLLSGHEVIDALVEDNEVYNRDIQTRAKLALLAQEIEQLEDNQPSN